MMMDQSYVQGVLTERVKKKGFRMSLLNTLDTVKKFSAVLIKKKQVIHSILTSNMPQG